MNITTAALIQAAITNANLIDDTVTLHTEEGTFMVQPGGKVLIERTVTVCGLGRDTYYEPIVTPVVTPPPSPAKVRRLPIVDVPADLPAEVLATAPVSTPADVASLAAAAADALLANHPPASLIEDAAQAVEEIPADELESAEQPAALVEPERPFEVTAPEARSIAGTFSADPHVTMRLALDLLLERIASERHRDVPFNLKDLGANSLGRLTCAKPAATDLGLAYSRTGLSHVADLANCARPRYWVANALYLKPHRFPTFLAELVERSRPRHALTARVAWDEKANTEYVRAVVSDRHAAEAGDDKALVAIVEAFLSPVLPNAMMGIWRGEHASLWSILLSQPEVAKTTGIEAQRRIQIRNSETKACRTRVRDGVWFRSVQAGVNFTPRTDLSAATDKTDEAAHIARGDVERTVSAAMERAMVSEVNLASVLTTSAEASIPVEAEAVALALARLCRASEAIKEREMLNEEVEEDTADGLENDLRFWFDHETQATGEYVDTRRGVATRAVPRNTALRAVVAVSIVASLQTDPLRRWHYETVAGDLLVTTGGGTPEVVERMRRDAAWMNALASAQQVVKARRARAEALAQAEAEKEKAKADRKAARAAKKAGAK